MFVAISAIQLEMKLVMFSSVGPIPEIQVRYQYLPYLILRYLQYVHAIPKVLQVLKGIDGIAGIENSKYCAILEAAIPILAIL